MKPASYLVGITKMSMYLITTLLSPQNFTIKKQLPEAILFGCLFLKFFYETIIFDNIFYYGAS